MTTFLYVFSKVITRHDSSVGIVSKLRGEIKMKIPFLFLVGANCTDRIWGPLSNTLNIAQLV